MSAPGTKVLDYPVTGHPSIRGQTVSFPWAGAWYNTAQSRSFGEPYMKSLRVLINMYAGAVEKDLAVHGLRSHDSPLLRGEASIVAVVSKTNVVVAFFMNAGSRTSHWLDYQQRLVSPQELGASVKREFGVAPFDVVELPLPGVEASQDLITRQASEHVESIRGAIMAEKLGTQSELRDLQAYIPQFLQDHPDPDRNIFLMMRFFSSPRLAEIHQAIKVAARGLGFNVVRADDRGYTGELWSNVRLYLACCNLGIAVFEDIERRDHNPNVALELGFMMGTGKSCLLLKEDRLPVLPADIMGHLYKTFDSYNIPATIAASVTRWITVDLGLA